MSHLYPRFDVLQKTFPAQSQDGLKGQQPSKATPLQARMDLYSAWSAAEDSLTKGPKKQIALYSGEYYAACTFGGLLACVSSLVQEKDHIYEILTKKNTY